MKTFDQLYDKIISDLENNLPAYLTYHDYNHTKLVLQKVIFIGEMEKVSDPELFLLKVAALYHDTGYKSGNENHEAESCRIVEKELPQLGFQKAEIDQICGMIMATKLPQQPKTHLEKILADADLEYLGTDNYEVISKKLYTELRNLGKIAGSSEWDKLQLSFLKNHHYHTAYAKKILEPVKQEHLKEIISKLDSQSS